MNTQNPITVWTNGQRAVVKLIESSQGEKIIYKLYRPGNTIWMFREYLNMFYLSRRLDIVPKLIKFHPFRKQLVMSFIEGQRVLEWILIHFGPPDISINDYLNFEEMDTDPIILNALSNFRQSTSDKACALKKAILLSYAKLHALKFQHGTSDPRNIIYDGKQVFIIDFDHARPCFDCVKNDNRALMHYFGIQAT